MYPKKNAAFTFGMGLASYSDPRLFQDSPTIAEGDVKVLKLGGSFANIATLPTVVGRAVVVTLADTEMNADLVAVLFHDAAGGEWCDRLVVLDTTAHSIDDLMLASALSGDPYAALTSESVGLSAIKTLIDAVAALGVLIKGKTDTIPANPAAIGSAMTLAASETVYWAQVELTRDEVNNRDEWTVLWYQDASPVTSGVTGTPTIRVVNRADGSDLVAVANMTTIVTGVYKYNESTNLTTLGEAVLVEVKATIDGEERTDRVLVTRDSQDS